MQNKHPQVWPKEYNDNIVEILVQSHEPEIYVYLQCSNERQYLYDTVLKMELMSITKDIILKDVTFVEKNKKFWKDAHNTIKSETTKDYLKLNQLFRLMHSIPNFEQRRN